MRKAVHKELPELTKAAMADAFGRASDSAQMLPEDASRQIPRHEQRLAVAKTLVLRGVEPEHAARAANLLEDNEQAPTEFRARKSPPEKFLVNL